MRIQTDNPDELVYRELVVYAERMVSKHCGNLGSASVVEVAHDVTTSFIISDSYSKTFDSTKGDLLSFFGSYVFRSVQKYLTFHKREYGRLVDFLREGDRGIKHSQDGIIWFVHSIEDFSDQFGCRESRVEMQGLIKHVRQALGEKAYCKVKLVDVFDVMLECVLYYGKVKVVWCADTLGMSSSKASMLITKVRNIAGRCYASS